MPFLAEKKESASALHLAIVPFVNEYSFKFSHINSFFPSAGRVAWNLGSLPHELRQIETPTSCEAS